MERNDTMLRASVGVTQIGLACAVVGGLGLTRFSTESLLWTTTKNGLSDEVISDVCVSALAGIISMLPSIYWQLQRIQGENSTMARSLSLAAATTSFVSLAHALLQGSTDVFANDASPGLGWRATLLACAAAGVSALIMIMLEFSASGTGRVTKFARPTTGLRQGSVALAANSEGYDLMPESVENRRAFLQRSGSAAAAAAAAYSMSPYAAYAAASDVEVPPTVTEYEFPSDWALTGTYDADARKVLKHMKLGTTLGKGANRMEEFHKDLKSEMIEFVSYYRRFANVSGKQSFSTLYTAINGYASHITSYGPKFPIPEKRRKRLYQEYVDIERQLKKGR